MAVKTDRKFWLYDRDIVIPAQEWVDMDAEIMKRYQSGIPYCTVDPKTGNHERGCVCIQILAQEVLGQNKRLDKARDKAEAIIAEKVCRCNALRLKTQDCEKCDDRRSYRNDWENIVNTMAYEAIWS